MDDGYRNVFRLYVMAVLDAMVPDRGASMAHWIVAMGRLFFQDEDEKDESVSHVYTVKNITNGEHITFIPRVFENLPGDYFVACQILCGTYKEAPKKLTERRVLLIGLDELRPIRDFVPTVTLEDYRRAVEWGTGYSLSEIDQDLMAYDKYLERRLTRNPSTINLHLDYPLRVAIFLHTSLLEVLVKSGESKHYAGKKVIVERPEKKRESVSRENSYSVYGPNPMSCITYPDAELESAHQLKPFYNPYIRSFYTNSRLPELCGDYHDQIIPVPTFPPRENEMITSLRLLLNEN
jgi:hypothetical protein